MAVVILSVVLFFPKTDLQAADWRPIEAQVTSKGETVNLCADQIGYVYRIFAGKVQRCLWNYTRNRWKTKWQDLNPICPSWNFGWEIHRSTE